MASIELDISFLMRKIRNTELVTVSDSSMQGLQLYLKNIYMHLHHQTNLVFNVNFLDNIKHEILSKILLTIEPHLNNSKQYTFRLRDRAFIKVKKYLLDHENAPLTVRQLIKETNVSIRTLEYTFLERIGITPKKVLKSLRLNRVNHELKLADADKKKISDIANYWGFWHMGQFAKDYKEMFGELPSNTLSQK